MNRVLFSFGNAKYYLSLIMLDRSVRVFGNVNTSLMLTDIDIPAEMYNNNSRHFKDGRGFGYWIWKAHFIKNFLEKSSYNDIFLYVDAGNEVIADLTPIYELCANDPKGIVLFDNRDGEPNGNVWKNDLWTKSDCFNLMGLTSQEYLQGNQINASYVIFRKTDFSVAFFSEFLTSCQNYNIISDAPSITPNFNGVFRDHRHDQSVLSLLSIKHGVTINRDPSQCGNSAITKESQYGQLFYHHRRKYLKNV